MLSFRDITLLKQAGADDIQIKLINRSFSSLEEVWDKNESSVYLMFIIKAGEQQIVPHMKQYTLQILNYVIEHVPSLTRDYRDDIELLVNLYNMSIEGKDYSKYADIEKRFEHYISLRLAAKILFTDTNDIEYFAMFFSRIHDLIISPTSFIKYIKTIIPYPILPESERLQLDKETSSIWDNTLEEI